ncbi:MAG: dockerin type I repeat-containing protein [Pirellulaceae bacterium]
MPFTEILHESQSLLKLANFVRTGYLATVIRQLPMLRLSMITLVGTVFCAHLHNVQAQQTIDYVNARWTTPIPVPGVNDTWEGNPSISDDGLTMYFASARGLSALGLGELDFETIWIANRDNTDTPFDTPQQLPLPIYLPGVSEVEPDITADGLELFFVRDTYDLFDGPNESNDDTLWVAKRESVDAPWGEPTKLSDAVHSLGCVSDPSITADGLELYLDIGIGSCNNQSIHVARRSSRSEPFGVPERVLADGLLPAISPDGLTLFHRSSAGTALRVSSRASRDEPFGPAQRIGHPSPFGSSFYSVDLSGDGKTLYMTSMRNSGIRNPDWPFPGGIDSIWQSSIAEACDLNADGSCDVRDLNLLSRRIRSGTVEDFYDLNMDSTVDLEDRVFWVHDFANTYFGDANLDGEFNSSDMTLVFSAAEYEDNITLNSTWAEGDWNGDGDFDSSDLILAFQDGGYEQGPRAGVQAVPEPASSTLWLLSLLSVVIPLRKNRNLRS